MNVFDAVKQSVCDFKMSFTIAEQIFVKKTGVSPNISIFKFVFYSQTKRKQSFLIALFKRFTTKKS